MLSLVLLVVGCALASTSGLVDQDSLYEVNHRQLVARRSRARLHRRQNGGPSALPDPGIKIVTSPYSRASARVPPCSRLSLQCALTITPSVPMGKPSCSSLSPTPPMMIVRALLPFVWYHVTLLADLQCRYSAMTGSPTTCYYYSDGSRDTDASDGPAAANCRTSV
jgi:hypothetical protein